METVALIVSAGRGRRISGKTPKQYLPLGGETILSKTARAFINHKKIDAVRIVIHPDDRDLYDAATGGLNLLSPVYGGPERQDSVRNGLESLEELSPLNVLIHDSVRPFVSHSLIDRILNMLLDGKGCIPGVPIMDAIKLLDDGKIVKSLERSNIWRVQTPQGFPFDQILAAHRSLIGNNLADDAAVAEAYGLSVVVVQGLLDNEKITNKEDLEKAMQKHSLSLPDIRVGNGYDVHRFSKGDFVTICGIKIPFSFGLEGHSDADVGLHALTDAILGALGKGDIGEYFPSTDEQWRNASSHIFLRHAGEVLSSMNASVQNLDITIICEVPKISPYRDEMKNNICEILSISPSRVNVKGKTNETLGFIGRKEGIAAQATATILIQ
ncbi:MAG TPA: bifunctional 2-C-methyl-D-erythritol 4-phosphate cytidylyltransferase/2-C-methyl-D-erythritol 2,4-cyclodiphosphate synthase [Rhodospirillales bacterium]|nr:bifunctional 2-C-methyl-D-erythritol 4-phosphate cytidylyltransferase/2-C-methyl-D-erythritol 2,4-cyclodiphosphate synthase [Rhodospirillales bacterium]